MPVIWTPAYAHSLVVKTIPTIDAKAYRNALWFYDFNKRIYSRMLSFKRLLYYNCAITLSSPKGISSRVERFSETVHIVQWLFVAIIYLLDYIYTDTVFITLAYSFPHFS